MNRIRTAALGMIASLCLLSATGAQAQQGPQRPVGGGAGRTSCSFCFNQFHAQLAQCDRFGNASEKSDCVQRAYDWGQSCQRYCVND